MATIQGSISKLVNNSNIMFESLGYVSSNVANWNTSGYKAERFESYLGIHNVLRGSGRVDARQGDHIATARPLDVAIEGAGYIPVTNERGETSYTRDGSFAVNSEGFMVASHNGGLVGTGIKLPAIYNRLKIKPDGTVHIQIKHAEPFEEIGKIPIVTFQNPEKLEVKEAGLVKATEESGPPELLTKHTKIKQGKLERANVDLLGEINETLKINGSIISSTRIIRIMDDMYRESINLRQ